MIIGLIGVGLLGSALGERLVAAGHELRAYDLDPARSGSLESHGAIAAASPSEAARGAGIVITCLMNAVVVRQAVLGPGGAAEQLAAGAILVDVTTCAPRESRRLATELGRRGIDMLDAPVSGSSSVARAGELVVFAGGPARAFSRCRPVFAAFARESIHAGDSGAGSTAKLVTNLVLGLNRLALAEGLALGVGAGLAPERLLEILSKSAAHSRALEAKGERMLARRFEPEARLSQHLKDVSLILSMGEELGLRLPVSELHEQLLRQGVEQGLGELDNSAIFELLCPQHPAQAPDEI